MERFRGGTIGLDVDRGSVKAVQVSKASDGYILRHVGYHRLPEGAIIEGEVADSEMLAKEIKDFWNLHSFRGKSVILGVAGRNVIVRFVDFPRLSPEDLDSALSFQAEEHIPMPPGDAVLDHVVLGASTENPEEDRVLLVAAHRAMISGYTSAARSGGLRPTGIDVKALALMRSSLPDALFDNEETVLLLDIGTEISNLVVVQNRMPTLTQFIPLGFRDFSEAVADAASIESDEADKQALNPRANIGSALDEPNEDDLESSSESETLALDPYNPEDEVEEADEASTETSTDAEEPETGESAPEASLEGEDLEEETVADPGRTLETRGDGDSDVHEAKTEELSVDPALMYDVRRGLEDAAGRLAEEVQRSVEFHNSRPEARFVSRIFISGEGALVWGLDGYIQDLLGVTTEKARPSAKLSDNRSNISDEQLAAMEPVLAIALGLAMEDE